MNKILDALGGSLLLRPGTPRPHNLASSRPDWVNGLLRGMPVQRAPNVLAHAFSLCGMAHRLCAELALDQRASAPDISRLLQRETFREHARRIGLDWVQQLAPGLQAEAIEALQNCPALMSDEALDAEPNGAWLGAHLLGCSPSAWLAAWEREPGNWLQEWRAGFKGWLPRLLRQLNADAPLPGARPLAAGEADLNELALQLHEDLDFVRRPRLAGHCAETGSWTRMNAPVLPCGSAALRLGARIAEMCRLCATAGERLLAHGVLDIARGERLAWVEMARGLLIHHAIVNIDAAQIVRYRVLAPTEWNFHPEGAVAAALESPCAEGAVSALMCAYDPCIPYRTEGRDHA